MSSAEPKKYLYTQEEVDRKVKETLIKDSKLDACLDKFHVPYIHAAGYEYLPYRCIEYDGSELKNPEQCTLLKETLMNDIETWLPEYWKENELSSATLDQKFDHLRRRIKKRWAHFWAPVSMTEEPIAKPSDGFMDTIRQTLTEKRARELIQAAERPTLEETPSLSSSSASALLKQLQSSIEGEQTNAIFACGGSIAIVPGDECQTHREGANETVNVQETEKEGEEHYTEENEAEKPDVNLVEEIALLHRESGPIRMTWSSSDGNNHKIVFPVDDVSALENLVNDCAPATFGFGDEDVLDTRYRHAGKLEPSNFLTSFHPADFGLLDMIEQTLLPSITSVQDNDLQCRRVKAELYKLNIYSGPSGLFRAHVDTPRSDNQFGSLVVCLPSKFQGGNLAVRHNGQIVDYDWSSFSSTHIQWAAFYSDCEHEISKVTEGHRATLTYNLYITEPVGAALISRPLVDPTSYPLYKQIKSILDQPGLFSQGGVLGFFCSHSYAHTSSTAKHSLPRKLKGSDLALFAVLKSLGLMVKVLPVLEGDGDYFLGNEHGLETLKSAQRNDMTEPHRMTTFYDDDADYDLEHYREKGYMSKSIYGDSGWTMEKLTFELPYTYADYGLQSYNDISKRWKRILVGRYPTGSSKEAIGARIGTALHPYKLSDRGGEHEVTDKVARMEWPHEFLPGITWVTSPKEERLALTHLCYGNEASIGSRYSCAAILAHIPPDGQRKEPGS